MRSNSGRDESRNNLKDPTLRDRDVETEVKPRTTERGSNARERGQEGESD